MVKKKLKLLAVLLFSIPSTILGFYIVAIFESVAKSKKLLNMNFLTVVKSVVSSPSALKLFLCLFVGIIILSIFIYFFDNKSYQSDLIEVTPNIKTPIVAGQGQCGTAKWMPKKDFGEHFDYIELDKSDLLIKTLTKEAMSDVKNEVNRLTPILNKIDSLIKQKEKCSDEELIEINKQMQKQQHELSDSKLITTIHDDIYTKSKGGEIQNKKYFKQGGLVVGKEDLPNNKERIYYIGKDVHTLFIGATRSGKTRCSVIQSITSLGLAGESLIVSDPKGELNFFTRHFLKKLGYELIEIDFRNPKKSTRFNFLQPIIDYLDDDDIPGAIDATWDLTSQLVGESKGEKLWTDGEGSILTACIMAVLYDNRAPKNHKYRNMANVYFFISKMCTPVIVQKGKNIYQKLPLKEYIDGLPISHPSVGLLSVSDVAPSRTRGSFYTSALMTLKLFTNPYIADMTSATDFSPMDVGNKKTAIFVMLPDDKETYYSLASLFIKQQYQMLVKSANQYGGRLINRVNLVLDEFGNFTTLSGLGSMLTVGGGRGIRFNLFLQGMSQLEEKYGKELSRTIIGNCENMVYLQTDDPETLKAISEKLGKYTVSTYSLSANHTKYSNPSSSHSVSLMERDLLKPDEVNSISRPYSLVTSRNSPAIMYAPDLTKWAYNDVLGLGDELHNQIVQLARDNIRPARVVTEKIPLWGIWDVYISAIIAAIENQKGDQDNEKD